MATDGKEHLSIVICGHVDSGKSTTTGRLIFELGGIPEREIEKLRAEADALGKSSFAFAFYMDRQKEDLPRASASARSFSISRSGMPPSSKMRRPVVVDLPEST